MSTQAPPMPNPGPQQESALQQRVWLDINWEDAEQFTTNNLICQYCFRPVGLDKSVAALASELRRKPILLSTSPLEPLWAADSSNTSSGPKPSRSSTPTPKRPLPTHFKVPSRPPSEDASLSGDILQSNQSARFAAAIPSVGASNAQNLALNPSQLRKNHINVMTPSLTLQLRQPKSRVNLAPHEPFDFKASSVPNGSIKRSLGSSSNNVPSSNPTSAGSIKYQPGQGSKEESKGPAPSSKWFGEDGLVWDEDGEPEKRDSDALGESMSDEQLFRELLAHTIAEFELELPLCCECAQAYMNRLLIELEDAEKDVLSMEAFLESFPSEDKLKSHFSDHESTMESLAREFDVLQKEFDRLLIQSAQQQQQISKYDGRTQELKFLKEDFWNRYAQFRHEDMCQRDLHGTVSARLDHKTKHLEMLRTSCGLNEAFTISFQGHFATINGLRLGLKSPNLKSTVDWDEISAAFGYLAFLVLKIGTALGTNWQLAKYRIRVDGSFSTVIEMNQKQGSINILNLHLDKESSWTLLRFRDHSSFDRGFEGFLRTIIEITNLVVGKDAEFILPYPITAEPLTIGGSPLTSSRANPEKWSHAAKQLSINVKTILQWLVSNGLVR